MTPESYILTPVDDWELEELARLSGWESCDWGRLPALAPGLPRGGLTGPNGARRLRARTISACIWLASLTCRSRAELWRLAPLTYFLTCWMASLRDLSCIAAGLLDILLSITLLLGCMLRARTFFVLPRRRTNTSATASSVPVRSIPTRCLMVRYSRMSLSGSWVSFLFLLVPTQMANSRSNAASVSSTDFLLVLLGRRDGSADSMPTSASACSAKNLRPDGEKCFDLTAQKVRDCSWSSFTRSDAPPASRKPAGLRVHPWGVFFARGLGNVVCLAQDGQQERQQNHLDEQKDEAVEHSVVDDINAIADGTRCEHCAVQVAEVAGEQVEEHEVQSGLWGREFGIDGAERDVANSGQQDEDDHGAECKAQQIRHRQPECTGDYAQTRLERPDHDALDRSAERQHARDVRDGGHRPAQQLDAGGVIRQHPSAGIPGLDAASQPVASRAEVAT
eukprot:scaffold74445_cov40-Prasinocladus_malaysianus.AAC.6